MRVKSVKKIERTNKKFHDLNVAPFNNYVLSNGAVVHNTGFSFSRLRPKGSTVRSTGGIASGPVSFMKAFNATTEVVRQGGFRRGANMAIMEVTHPDILDFITSKDDHGVLENFNLSIGATEEFMSAVATNDMYDLIDPVTKQKTGELNAKEVFRKTAEGAWKKGCPGIVFLDRINACNPTPDLGDIESTNPCVVADTLIAVADGRLAVSIEDLCNKGEDVPVYCCDDNGEIVVREMRNPRITGRNSRILKVAIENGHELRVTENHEFIMSDGSVVQAKDLKENDSLSIMNRFLAPIEVINPNSNSRSQNYYWINNSRHKQWNIEHRFIADHYYGKINRGFVVHHKNFVGSDNNPSNLQVMTSSDHRDLHRKGMLGKNNPSNRFPERNIFNNKEWQEKQRLQHHVGAKRSDETRRRIGEATAERFADEGYRQRHSILAKEAYSRNISNYEIGFEKRARRFLEECESKTNLPCFLIGNSVFVRKICEYCGESFEIPFSYREVSFCDKECFNKHMNSDSGIRDRRIDSLRKTYYEKSVLNVDEQIKCFVDLKKELLREPLKKEWEEECKKRNVSYRFGTKYGMGGYKELKEKSCVLNHKVVSVSFDGFEDVYNGTVDEFHNFYIGHFEETQKGLKNFVYVNTKQCGEQPLLPYESCNLGSINIVKMMREVQREDQTVYELDVEKLEETVGLAVRFLDNVIEVNQFPIKEIEIASNATRKIGLGVMGFADALIMMKIPYNSDEALAFAREVMHTVQETAYLASEELGKQRGNYPAFVGSVHEKNGYMRNASRTTIAPTGTLSMIANCSGGIEPIFDITFERRQNDKIYTDEHYYYNKVKDVWKKDELEKIFVTANNIDPEWHIRMQAVFQRYTDNAVSKTINLPYDATVEEIESIYLSAYEKGLKGTTIYRNGSRDIQIFSSGSGKVVSAERPSRISGFTEKIATGCGSAYVTINMKDDRPYELFTVLGKAGTCASAQLEAISRLISLLFKHGVPLSTIAKHLRFIRCSNPYRAWGDGSKIVMSCPDAIGSLLEALAKETEDGGDSIMEVRSTLIDGHCPECGTSLVHSEGCSKCLVCGYSKC